MKLQFRLLALTAMLFAGVANAQDQSLQGIQQMARNGESDMAIRALDKRIKADEKDIKSQFLKGMILMQHQRMDEARQVYEDITINFPRYPEAYNNLAVIHASKGEFESARQALLKATGIVPDYAPARANLGDLYARMAAEAYEEAVRLDPADAASAAKLRRVNALFGG